MRHAWRVAARNLSRNRRRNLATAVAIALGTTGLLLLGGYAVRIERFLRTNTVYLQRTGHLVVLKQGGLEGGSAQPAKFALTAQEQRVALEVLHATPGVEFVGRQLRGMGLAGNGCKTVPFVALGVELALERQLLRHPEVRSVSPELARPVSGQDLSAYPQVAGATALSTGLFRLLGKEKVHDQLAGGAPAVTPDCHAADAKRRVAADAHVQLTGMTWGGTLSAVDAEVVNVFHTPLAETEDSTLLTSLETLQQLYDTDAVSALAVFLADAADAHRLQDQLQRALRARGLAVEVFPFDDERVGPYYAGTIPLLRALVGFIGLLVAAVVLLSVLNAMTLSVLERTPELGTFRALGFTRGEVVALYVREAVLLALGSVGAGLLAGLLIAWGVNLANVRFKPPGVPDSIQLLLTPTPLLFAALAAFLVPMAAFATWLAVRRRVATPLVHLLSSPAA